MAKYGLAHSNEPIHVKKIWRFNFKTVWPLIWPLWPLLAFLKFFLDFQGLRSLVPCSNHENGHSIIKNSYRWKFSILNQCDRLSLWPKMSTIGYDHHAFTKYNRKPTNFQDKWYTAMRIWSWLIGHLRCKMPIFDWE